MRKVDRPTAEELVEMIKTMSWVDIGEKYNVSNNAIKKWAISYGLPIPVRRKRSSAEKELVDIPASPNVVKYHYGQQTAYRNFLYLCRLQGQAKKL